MQCPSSSVAKQPWHQPLTKKASFQNISEWRLCRHYFAFGTLWCLFDVICWQCWCYPKAPPACFYCATNKMGGLQEIYHFVKFWLEIIWLVSSCCSAACEDWKSSVKIITLNFQSEVVTEFWKRVVPLAIYLQIIQLSCSLSKIYSESDSVQFYQFCQLDLA